MNELIEIRRVITLRLSPHDWKLYNPDGHSSMCTAQRLNSMVALAINERDRAFAEKLAKNTLDLFKDEGVTDKSHEVLDRILDRYFLMP